MSRVDTTAFSMPAWTSGPERNQDRVAKGAGCYRFWRALWLLTLCCALWMAPPVQAREPGVQHSGLHRVEGGLDLSVRLDLEASPPVEDALLKGVPIYFVWQADVVRERWYWTDKRISQATRTLRLVYQPLTRRWRVSLATDAAASAAGLQYALHQSFDSLPEALAGVSRVAGWRITEPGRLEDGVKYLARWRFRLDLSLLPRPFQLGMANQPEWTVEVQREMDVPARDDAESPGQGAASDSR